MGHDPEEQHSHKSSGDNPTHRQKEAHCPGLGLNAALLWLGQMGLIRDRKGSLGLIRVLLALTVSQVQTFR